LLVVESLDSELEIFIRMHSVLQLAPIVPEGAVPKRIMGAQEERGMAEIKVDDVVYRLDSEFKKALAETMKKFAPNVPVNIGSAFKYFQGRVYAHCSKWEKVPDSCVRP
jgi:hypothetical protein